MYIDFYYNFVVFYGLSKLNNNNILIKIAVGYSILTDLTSYLDPIFLNSAISLSPGQGAAKRNNCYRWWPLPTAGLNDTLMGGW